MCIYITNKDKHLQIMTNCYIVIMWHCTFRILSLIKTYFPTIDSNWKSTVTASDWKSAATASDRKSAATVPIGNLLLLHRRSVQVIYIYIYRGRSKTHVRETDKLRMGQVLGTQSTSLFSGFHPHLLLPLYLCWVNYILVTNYISIDKKVH